MKNFSLFAAACSLLLLSACAVAPPAAPLMHVETVEVKTEVPVPCVDSIPQPAQPFLAESDLLAGTGSQVADNLWIDHKARSDYIGDLLAVLQGCTKLPSQTPALQ